MEQVCRSVIHPWFSVGDANIPREGGRGELEVLIGSRVFPRILFLTVEEKFVGKELLNSP